jgi:single stranded DNA-binding protein (ssb)
MINSVVLVGRLTKDIEIRKTQNNLSVTSFSIAVDNRTKDAEGNRTTSFINCTAWRQNADILSQYAHKGSLIGVEGSLQQRSFTRRDGTKASVLEVVVNSVTLLESKGTRTQGANGATQTVEPSSAPVDVPDTSEEKTDVTSGDLTDDDLPF